MNLKMNPIRLCTAFLFLYSAVAFFFKPEFPVAIHFLLTVGVGGLYYFVVTFLSKKRKVLDNTLISCLILFLVLHYPTTRVSMVLIVLTTFLTLTIKFFLEYKGSPFANPVAVAILVVYFFSKILPFNETLFASWWGASFQGWISLAIIAVWAFVGVKKWRKVPLVLTFLISAAILLLVWGKTTESLEYIFTDATIYFLATIMLLEPRTSPVKCKGQLAFAVIAAILYTTLSHFSVTDYELWAIVGANFSFLIMKHSPLRKIGFV
ncbi:MAG: hypothetical protein WCP97_06510 [bacterium]